MRSSASSASVAMVTEVTIKGSVANTLAGLPLQPVAEAADKQEADKQEGELADVKQVRGQRKVESISRR